MGAFAESVALPAPAEESAVVFECEGERLLGIMHHGAPAARRGMVIVVGGPQYRVGSHRQFVLLARGLASAGVPVLRFDYRGMGDSDGARRSFEAIDADIRAAVDELCRRAGVTEVVLWGLCDGASAALLYAPSDTRVAGIVLLNPWVRTEQTLARTRLSHYYGRRLFDPHFWRKLAAGALDLRTSTRDLIGSLRGAAGKATGQDRGDALAPLPQRMAVALTQYSGRALVILSGNDLTAQEFRQATLDSLLWRRSLDDGRVTRRELEGANHTFARADWRDQVTDWTREWIASW
jgi:exosortase A-associated hydrolase 1